MTTTMDDEEEGDPIGESNNSRGRLLAQLIEAVTMEPLRIVNSFSHYLEESPNFIPSNLFLSAQSNNAASIAPLESSSGIIDDYTTANDGGPLLIDDSHHHQFNQNQESTWSQLMLTLFYKHKPVSLTPETNQQLINDTTSQLGTTMTQHQYQDIKFDINWSSFILACILIMLMLSTAIGNLFVIVAIVVEKNLRTIGNYLVLSLAIADLLVACLVMPLAGIYQILDKWTLGVLLCDIWTSADVFCCTASILHLLAIALDRYWAVTRVNYIRCQRNERRILFMILFVWMAASIISLAPVFGWKDDQFEWRITNENECLLSQDIGYQIFATCTTFYFPLTLTLIFYWKIYQVARKRIRRKPGNRIKISLQHPSSSSSNSSPNIHHSKQVNQTSSQSHKQQPQTYHQAIASFSPNVNEYKTSVMKSPLEMSQQVNVRASDETCLCQCHVNKSGETCVLITSDNRKSDIDSERPYGNGTLDPKTENISRQSSAEVNHNGGSQSSTSDKIDTSKYFAHSQGQDGDPELDIESHCNLCDELENQQRATDSQTSSKSIPDSRVEPQGRWDSDGKCELCRCCSQRCSNPEAKLAEVNQFDRRDTEDNLSDTVEGRLLDNKSDSCLVIAASTTNIAVSTSVRTQISNANSIHGFCTAAEVIESRRERKAAKTLAIITGVFVMCWLPFFIMAITMPLLDLKPHKYVFAVLLWLGYVNSMLNPIIYTIFSPDFRKAFKRLIGLDAHDMKQRKRRRQQNQLVNPPARGNSGASSTSCANCLNETCQLLGLIHRSKLLNCCIPISSASNDNDSRDLTVKYNERCSQDSGRKKRNEVLEPDTEQAEAKRNGEGLNLSSSGYAKENTEASVQRHNQNILREGRPPVCRITNDF